MNVEQVTQCFCHPGKVSTMMINTTEALVGYEGERALELGGRDVRPAVRRRVCERMR